MTKVIARHDVDPGVLEDRLYEFNAAVTGKDDGETLATIADKPLGHAEHWMRLDLRATR